MTEALSWFELSRVPDDTLIVFVMPWDIFDSCVVPAGTTGRIVDNGLNEIWGHLVLEVDSDYVKGALRHWEGFVILGGHLKNVDHEKYPEDCTDEENRQANEWHFSSPLAVRGSVR